MSITDLYKQLVENKITKGQFLQQVRINPSVKHMISPLMSFDDTLKVFKSKGLIKEVKPISFLLNECECDKKLGENIEDKYPVQNGDADYNDEDMSTQHDMSKHKDLIWTAGLKLQKFIDRLEKTNPKLCNELFEYMDNYMNSIGLEDIETKYDDLDPQEQTKMDQKLSMAILKFFKGKNITVNPYTWQIVPNPKLNESKENVPEIDLYSPNEYIKGVKEELEKQGKEKDLKRAKKKVLTNLKKDPIYYTNKEAGVKKPQKANNQMVPVTKKNLVDKKNQMKKSKNISEVQLNLAPGEQPNKVTLEVKKFLESDLSIKDYEKQISLQNHDNNKCILRYDYYDYLPNKCLNELLRKFEVIPDKGSKEVTYTVGLKSFKNDTSQIALSARLKDRVHEMAKGIVNEIFGKNEPKQKKN